jgi:hypothetical protein
MPVPAIVGNDGHQHIDEEQVFRPLLEKISLDVRHQSPQTTNQGFTSIFSSFVSEYNIGQREHKRKRQ